jgi:lipopolysaccharide export system permease protein
MNLANRAYVTQTAYLSYRSAEKKSPQEPKERQINAPVVPASPAARYEGPPVLDIDSVLKSIPASQRRSLYANAIAQSENTKTDLVIRSGESIMTQNNMRRHQAEYYRKFTLPFTCLVFFFIGAPLGAIIRRGGLGFPVVVSFLLFIVYYIIDNVGYKLARDGVWIAWHGVCLSSFVLFPLGVFITYKANKDSALLNADAYRKLLRRFLQTPAMQTASFYYNKYLHKYIIAPVKTLFKKKQR